MDTIFKDIDIDESIKIKLNNSKQVIYIQT